MPGPDGVRMGYGRGPVCDADEWLGEQEGLVVLTL